MASRRAAGAARGSKKHPRTADKRNKNSATSIPPGRAIFRQGEPSDSLFRLQAGLAKATALSESGREAVIAIIGPGVFFGESCLIGRTRRVSTVTAITPCVVERFDAATVRRFIDKMPKFHVEFVEYLLRRSLQLQQELLDHHFHSTEKRLARTLVRLAGLDQSGRSEGPIMRISQEIIAEMVGTTRSRVNFFMNKFRRLGLIEYNGTITVRRTLAGVDDQ
jgi:CRP/FNR family transcriptional regulator, cyclic AMP receptor protein